MVARQEWVERFKPYLTETPKDIGETRGYCPLHENPEKSKTPSGSFNFGTKLFSCFGGDCAWKGSFRQLVSKLNKKGWSEDSKNANAKKPKPLPKLSVVQAWHESLLRNDKLMDWLRDTRGIRRKVVKRMQMGYRTDFPAGNKGRQAEPRFTLPVYDAEDDLTNVRYYKPGATEGKMKNATSHGSGSLYGVDALEQDIIILTEGEMDCLLARSLGLNAMTHTAGAKAWQTKWSPLFNKKTVYIIFDCDETGRGGARKTAASIRKHGGTAHVVNLNLPTKGADLTDFIVEQGHTVADLRELMQAAEETSEAKADQELDLDNPISVTLQESMHQDLTDTAIFFTGTVAGKADEPYTLPRTGNLTCDLGNKDWMCNNCELSSYNGTMDYELKSHENVLLKLLEAKEADVHKAVLGHLGVQPTCKRVDVSEYSSWAVEELFVIPSVDDRDEEIQVPVERRAYNVGHHATPMNTTMQFTGVNTADPRSRRSTLLTWDSKETKLSLDKFEVTPAIREILEGFQPRDGQTPMERLVEIAQDLSDNVTGIYKRPGLHIAYDLVWHSVLNFKFNDTLIGKGWLELLVMGDTRTGKSEAALKLAEHYQAGILKSCEGVSFAGLIGGSERMGGGGKFGTKWGVIPLHDRRLVVLDEVSGMAAENIIGRMSSVRSSGVAQNTKMGGSETSARTRLIWISNPKEGSLEDMPRGAIDALKELVPNPEDVARFDFAMSVSKDEVKTEVINSAYHKKVKHKFTRDMCSLLVTWAWSRNADQVDWDEGAEDRVFEEAENLGHEYIPDPPLVQAENMRTKLARMAVAIAARLFSTKDGERVWVTEDHVEAAVMLLHKLYGMESFGYRQHSKRVMRDRKMARQNSEALRQYLDNNEDVLLALRILMLNAYFKPKDFETYGNMDRAEAQTAIVELTRLRMIRSVGRGNMKMQPELIQLLKELEAEEEE